MSATGDFIVAADYNAALDSYLSNCQLGYGFSSNGTNDCVACSPGTVVEQSVCAYIMLPISHSPLSLSLSLSLSLLQAASQRAWARRPATNASLYFNLITFNLMLIHLT